MIITVTLNPAVDKTYTASSVMLGQVNRMQSVKNIAGGKGINVTKILRQYGYEVTALGFLGGYTGTFIKDYVKEIKAAGAFTKIKEETRSSINIIAEDGYITEILEPGPEISKEELENFLADFKIAIADSELVVLSGSAPRGIPDNFYETLIRLAKKQDKRVILDTSGAYLVEGVKSRPFMIKPNLRELEYLLGCRVNGVEDAAAAARKLVAGGIEHVMISLGKKGLLYASEGEEKILFAKTPRVKERNPIGCGDSVVASFSMSCLLGESNEQIIRKAAAISAANATTLDSAVIPMHDAEALYHKIDISYLS